MPDLSHNDLVIGISLVYFALMAGVIALLYLSDERGNE